MPNIKVSHYLYNTFKENPNNLDMKVECRFSNLFEKWTPIRFVNNKPWNSEDIEEIDQQIAMEAQQAQQQRAQAEADANAQGKTLDANGNPVLMQQQVPTTDANGNQLNPDGTPVLPSKFEVQANELEFAA